MAEGRENLIKSIDESKESGMRGTEKFKAGERVRLLPDFVEEWGLNGKEMAQNSGKILAIGPTHIQIRWRKSLVVEVPLSSAEQELEIVE